MSSAAQTTAQTATLAPSKPFHETLAGQALLAVAASAFVGVCARLAVPLPFTPVPLSLVTFGVLLVGLSLSPVVAFSAMVLYLLEGASGLPVFSPGGPGGLIQLFGTNGGYLFSYPLAAAAAAAIVRLARRSTRLEASPALRYASAAVAGAIASTFFFLVGATWLASFLHLSTAAALHMGVTPFLPGEVIKIAAAAGLYSAGRTLARA
jgi:biotin transport system substrate-specific component